MGSLAEPERQRGKGENGDYTQAIQSQGCIHYIFHPSSKLPCFLQTLIELMGSRSVIISCIHVYLFLVRLSGRAKEPALIAI